MLDVLVLQYGKELAQAPEMSVSLMRKYFNIRFVLGNLSIRAILLSLWLYKPHSHLISYLIQC